MEAAAAAATTVKLKGSNKEYEAEQGTTRIDVTSTAAHLTKCSSTEKR